MVRILIDQLVSDLYVDERRTMLRIFGGGATVDERPWNPNPAIEFTWDFDLVKNEPLGMFEIAASVDLQGWEASLSYLPGIALPNQVSLMATLSAALGKNIGNPATTVDVRGGLLKSGGIAITTDGASYSEIKLMYGIGEGGKISVGSTTLVPLLTQEGKW